MSRDWVFKSNVVVHETDDIFFGNDQFTADGLGIVRVVRNWPGAFREYEALSVELNRRFRGGWAFRSNLTIGEATGNTANSNTNSNLFEGLGGIEVDTGATEVTTRFQNGRLGHDIDRLNIVAMKRLELGEHAVTLGGFFAASTGRYFGPTTSTTVAHPVTGLEIDTVTFTAPRDGQQLDDIYTLDLSAMWSFPIRGRMEGTLGFEAANVTDEQNVLQVDTNTPRADQLARGLATAARVPPQGRVPLLVRVATRPRSAGAGLETGASRRPRRSESPCVRPRCRACCGYGPTAGSDYSRRRGRGTTRRG